MTNKSLEQQLDEAVTEYNESSNEHMHKIRHIMRMMGLGITTVSVPQQIENHAIIDYRRLHIDNLK